MTSRKIENTRVKDTPDTLEKLTNIIKKPFENLIATMPILSVASLFL